MFARKSTSAVPAHQARIDAIVAAARAASHVPPQRCAASFAQPVLTDRSPQIVDQRLEEELATISRQVDAIGDRLSDDPILLNRYPALLQALDNAAQSLAHLAVIAGAEDRYGAAATVPVGELRARLLRGNGIATPPRLERSAANPFAHQ